MVREVEITNEDKGKRLVAEDWKYEYWKYLLENKFSKASDAIGIAYSNPTEENIKIAFGYVVNAITSMQIGEDKEYQKQRDQYLKKLDIIHTILYGDPRSEYVKRLCFANGVIIKRRRIDLNIFFIKENLPVLLPKLRKILTDAHDFAISIGLIRTLPVQKKRGFEKALSEEGFENIDI